MRETVAPPSLHGQRQSCGTTLNLVQTGARTKRADRESVDYLTQVQSVCSPACCTSGGRKAGQIGQLQQKGSSLRSKHATCSTKPKTFCSQRRLRSRLGGTRRVDRKLVHCGSDTWQRQCFRCF
jgi:hypothetical protein